MEYVNDSGVVEEGRGGSKESRSDDYAVRFLQRSEFNFGAQVSKLRHNLMFLKAAEEGSEYHMNMMKEMIRKDMQR